MSTRKPRIAAPFAFVVLLTACGGLGASAKEDASVEAEHEAAEGGHGDEGAVTLAADQIAAAGIQLARPTIGGSGTIELPATIESDPERTQVVSAAIGGRIVSLSRNLGEPVNRGTVLAVIESREAAQLKGNAEAARARLQLATSNLAREQRLFTDRVSPEQDLIAARTALTEARIALRQAQGQVGAAGSGGGGLNRLGIASPISGQVIARNVVLGQTVTADAELYRVANLDRVSLALNVQPADAGRILAGATVTVRAVGRHATARISFVSPVLDPATRLVPVIAMIDNGSGQWRAGEAVTASIQLAGRGGDGAIRVPLTAIQSVKSGRVVFVRTATGFKATPVSIGDTTGDSVLVSAGLTGREEIATINSFTLKAELGKGEATHED